ncbi:alpha/beta hydrolase [Maribacter chungangensis]|uniref:Alpha/beta hydrolase n=1 Tax=Maribacter chungangensis TaxID=1069117 RepID=A0ABW3B7L6_9FLAO
MKMIRPIVLFLVIVAIQTTTAQKVKDFFYAEPETKELPVFVRGNAESKKVLLFVQGGGADTGIDFGRSNYPKWKKTLESEVAIAYFDQRGLNKPIKKIDTSKITATQVSKDIIRIAKALKKRYGAAIHLLGHSLGGQDILRCLANFSEEASFISSAMVLNTPITTDFSPERYQKYRPNYLKNLSKHFLGKKVDTVFWKEAQDWMVQRDSIGTIEDSKKWNYYVDNAFSATKRKTGLGMVLNVIFSKPYNLFTYLNQKDNKLVGDRLWYAEKALWDAGEQTTVWELLPKINHPVLLLTGRYDAIAVPEELHDAHKLLRNSKLVILSKSGHQSFLDQPDVLHSTISGYLKRL